MIHVEGKSNETNIREVLLVLSFVSSRSLLTPRQLNIQKKVSVRRHELLDVRLNHLNWWERVFEMWWRHSVTLSHLNDDHFTWERQVSLCFFYSTRFICITDCDCVSECMCILCFLCVQLMKSEKKERNKSYNERDLCLSALALFRFSLCVQNNLRCTGEEPRWRIYLTHRKLSLSGEKSEKKRKEKRKQASSEQGKHLPPFIGPFVASIATAV